MERQGGSYEAPVVIDHGTLANLTEACVFGNNGDAAFPSGNGLGASFGRSNPAFGCNSN